MTFFVGVCVQLILAGGLSESTGRELDPIQLLEGYRLCSEEFQTISYDLQSESRSSKRRFVYNVKHCADHDRVQWIGNQTLELYDEHGAKQSVTSERVRDTYDGIQMVHLFRDFNEDYPKDPPRARLYTHAGSSLPAVLQGLGESIEYGGPLVGKVGGNDQKSVYDLLVSASDLKFSSTATKIMGYDAYLLEADTQYGVVRAWVSPDAGGHCLKWQIEKAHNQFYRDGEPVAMTSTKWVATYEVERIEQIEGRTITTQAKFNLTVSDGVAQRSYDTQRYRLTNIDFDPDYEALGAFKIQLPEGTVVSNDDAPGVMYRWMDGRLQPLLGMGN